MIIFFHVPYVERAVDWQYSSIHRFISAGVLNKDWGGDVRCEEVDSFGEMSFRPI